MKIRKISTIIAIASLVGLITTAGEGKTFHNVKLLASKSASYGCVINGDNQLIIKNKNGDIEGYASIGQMLNLGTSSNGETFVKVHETGVEGYLDNSDILDISSGMNSKFQDLNLDGKTINISSKVNLRTEPSMNAKVIDKLSNDISVKIIGKQGQWYKVKADNEVGYIFDEYIGVLKNNESNIAGKTVGVISQNNNMPVTISNNTEVSSTISPKIVNEVPSKVDVVSQKIVKEVSNQINNKISDVKQISAINNDVKEAQKAINHKSSDVEKTSKVSNIKPSSATQKVDAPKVTATEKTHKKEIEKIPVSTNKSENDSNKTIVKNESSAKTSVKKDSNKKQIVEPKKEEGTTTNKINSKDKNTDNSKDKVSQKDKNTNVSKVNKDKDAKTGSKNIDNSKANKTSEMTTLPNVPLKSWETGFNTVQNKMNAEDSNGSFMMNIYTPENPVGYVGGMVYVRFANTNEICSGQLVSLITPEGGTNSNYGYLYEIPLYYKNVYKGTLYYGTNTYGYIQNGGYIAPGQTSPTELILNSGYKQYNK